MIELTIVYESIYMSEDKLVLKADTIEEAKQQYFNWWKSYGKDEKHAIDAMIETNIREIK